jgi:hypothetical protein
VRNQQRTGKTARQPFITQITHVKLETASRRCATSSAVVRVYRNCVIARHFVLDVGTAEMPKKIVQNFVAGGRNLA